jgi:hypothetical protein
LVSLEAIRHVPGSKELLDAPLYSLPHVLHHFSLFGIGDDAVLREKLLIGIETEGEYRISREELELLPPGDGHCLAGKHQQENAQWKQQSFFHVFTPFLFLKISVFLSLLLFRPDKSPPLFLRLKGRG